MDWFRRNPPLPCDAASINTMNLQQVIDTTALLANKLKQLATTHVVAPPAGAGTLGPLVVVAVASAAERAAAQAVYDAATTYISTIPADILRNPDVGARQVELVDAMTRLNSILIRARGGAAAGAGAPDPTSENVRIASEAVTAARTALEAAVAAAAPPGGGGGPLATAEDVQAMRDALEVNRTAIRNIDPTISADVHVTAAITSLEALNTVIEALLPAPGNPNPSLAAVQPLSDRLRPLRRKLNAAVNLATAQAAVTAAGANAAAVAAAQAQLTAAQARFDALPPMTGGARRRTAKNRRRVARRKTHSYH